MFPTKCRLLGSARSEWLEGRAAQWRVRRDASLRGQAFDSGYFPLDRGSVFIDVSPPTLQLFKRSHRSHVIEILVHYLKANRFIESYRRYIRYTGRDAHAVHPVRPHPPQTLE